MALITSGLQVYFNPKDGIKSGNKLDNLAPAGLAGKQATLTGGAQIANGAIHMDGIDDLLSVPLTESMFTTSASPYTLEYVFTPRQTTGDAEIVNGGVFMGTFSWGNLYWEMYSSPTANVAGQSANTTIKDPNVLYLQITYSGTAFFVYVNGTQIGTSSMSNHSLSAGGYTTTYFSSNNDLSGFKSDVHAIRIYNRVLSSAEMTDNRAVGIETGIAPPPAGTEVHKGGLALYYNPKNEASGATSLTNIAPNGTSAPTTLVGSSVNASKVLTLAAGKSSHAVMPDHASYETIGSWSAEYIFTLSAGFPIATTKLLESENATTFVDEALVTVVRDATNTRLDFILFNQSGAAINISAPATALATEGRKHITIMHNAMTGNLFVYINNVQVYTQAIVPVSFKTVGSVSNILVNESSGSIALNFEAFRTYTDILSTSERQQNFDNGAEIGLVESAPPADPTAGMPPDTAIPVKAETATFANGVGDIADSPNIWYNAASPADSVVFGTNKAANGGLGVYDLTGAQLQFLAVGACNNVDVRDGVFGNRVIVVTTNRTNNSLTFAWFDRTTRQLTLAESIAVGFEPYGCCLYVSPVNGDVYAFVTENAAFNGQLDQYRITASGNVVSGVKVRDMTTSSLAEGCAAHDSQAYLFLAVEEEGFYRYNAEPGAGNTPLQIDTVSRSGGPVADLEGVTIAYENSTSGYIIISSQGNSSFHIYDLAPPHAWRKSFTLVANGAIDAVSDTDGIAVLWKPMGPLYPNGIMVAHDSTNTGSDKSNFKYAELTSIIGTAPVASVPKVKIGELVASPGINIPIFDIANTTQKLRVQTSDGLGWMEIVATTDPAASKIRVRINGVTMALKL